jgi:asparagine synthase (glutamine-hydrolysing)
MFGGYSRYSTLSFPRTWKTLAGIGSILNSLTPHKAGYYRRLRYIHALQPKNPAQMMALLLTEEDPAAHPEQIFAHDFRRQVIASNPFAHYQECWDSLQGEDLVNQMLLTDSMVILPDIFLEKVDRSTMAASVEVRVPFLDHDLVDFCMRLSGPQKVRLGHKKWLLKKSLEGLLPDEILYGKKTGFGVPYGYWLRQSLRPLFFDHLQKFQRNHPNILDDSNLHKLYEEHTSQTRDRSFLLWKTLNFMIWANQTSIQIS